MKSIVIEHVPVADLPQAWRERLGLASEAKVTVRIEAEKQGAAVAAEPFHTDDPAFGIWRDRDDGNDVEAYLHRVRAPRFTRDGSRNEPRASLDGPPSRSES